MNRQARVILAYATVKVLDPTGKPTVYGFHKDDVFPPNADPEDVARLVRRGYAEWVDSGEAKAAEQEETQADKAEAATEAEPIVAVKATTKAAKV